MYKNQGMNEYQNCGLRLDAVMYYAVAGRFGYQPQKVGCGQHKQAVIWSVIGYQIFLQNFIYFEQETSFLLHFQVLPKRFLPNKSKIQSKVFFFQPLINESKQIMEMLFSYVTSLKEILLGKKLSRLKSMLPIAHVFEKL